MRFPGKTVIITGAASGIGAESARLFAREGATVFASDIDEVNGQRLADETEGDIRFQPCDVCKVSDIEALMQAAERQAQGDDAAAIDAAVKALADGTEAFAAERRLPEP